MRAKQTREILVNGADRLPLLDRGPNQPVHVLDCLDLGLNNAHPTFKDTACADNFNARTIYNTVVLAG
jgi:hypothetical protein